MKRTPDGASLGALPPYDVRRWDWIDMGTDTGWKQVVRLLPTSGGGCRVWFNDARSSEIPAGTPVQVIRPEASRC